MARQRGMLAVLMATTLATAAAGCGGSATPTPARATQAPATAMPATPVAEATAPTPTITDEPLPALEMLWEAVGEPNTAGATYSPAVDPLTGDIWVAVSFDGLIWIFSKDGEYKGSFGKPGKAEGEFDFVRTTCPCGAGALAFAPDGTLFVADTGTNRVQKFNPDHEFVNAWGSFGAGEGQFADANQIATNGREVFVSDDARLDIQVFDMDGTYLRTIKTSGWLAIDPVGDLLVSHEGTVLRYHPDGGTYVESFELGDYQDGYHIGLALDGKGRLFFNFQRDQDGTALGLGSLDPATAAANVWSTGGETIAIADGVLYEANFVGPGWPKAAIRAYALPQP